MHMEELYFDGVTPSAIQGDGAPYVNGQSGVATVIHVCSGTYDATLLLSSRRTMTFSFAGLLATNSNTPAWALSGSTISVGFINVRNIAYVPPGLNRGEEYTFTTRFGSTFSGHFQMLNPSPSATITSPNPNVAIANAPYDDSLVVVHHCPAGANAGVSTACLNLAHETWFVYPDSTPTTADGSQTGWTFYNRPFTQVGTLLTSSQKSGEVNAGEFSMPFYFTISSLQ
jgi:hypothetical protein